MDTLKDAVELFISGFNPLLKKLNTPYTVACAEHNENVLKIVTATAIDADVKAAIQLVFNQQLIYIPLGKYTIHNIEMYMMCRLGRHALFNDCPFIGEVNSLHSSMDWYVIHEDVFDKRRATATYSQTYIDLLHKLNIGFDVSQTNPAAIYKEYMDLKRIMNNYLSDIIKCHHSLPQIVDLPDTNLFRRHIFNLLMQ